MNNSSYINPDGFAPCPYAASIFFTTAIAVITSAAFIGNILVFLSVYKTATLRTSTNYYYVNMAASDFLANLTTWPPYLIEEVITSSGGLLQSSPATVGCKIGTYIRLVSYTVSALSLVLIAVDRFIATVFPLKAMLITPKVRAALLCATWLIPVVHCIPVFYYSRVEEVGLKAFCRFGWNGLALMVYFITSVAIFNFIPLIAIIIIYYRIMRVLKRRHQSDLNDDNDTNSQRKRSKQTQNVMKIFKSVVAAYLVCICLFGIYFILLMTLPELHGIDKCNFIRVLFNFLFPLISTSINPVILFTFSTNFRHALQNLLPFNIGECRSCCQVSPHQENIPLPKLAT